MNQPEGKIGIREFISIAILTIGTKLSDETPHIFFQKLENAAWMSPIIIGILSIIPLWFLLIVLNQFNDKNIADIIYSLFGKYIGFVIMFSIWAVLLISLVVDSAINVDIIGTMYFSRTSPLIIYALLMSVCAYSAKKGLEQIGSVAWALIVWIKISLVASLILSVVQGEGAFLFPLFGSGKWEVLKESSIKLSLYCDFFYLGLIFPYLSSKKAFNKGSWIALFIITVEISLALLSYLMIFDYTGVKMVNYPFHEAIRYLGIGFLANIETFFFPFWIIATFIRFSFYLFINAMVFGRIFKIKEFEFTIPIIATLVVFLGIIPQSPTFTFANIKETMLGFISVFYFGMPPFLWLVAKIKGALKNGKKEVNH